MPLGQYVALLLAVGSCVAWAVLPLGSYVASLPAAVLSALPSIIMAARIPKPLRADPKHYLWPTGLFVVVLGLIALGMSLLPGMGARLT